MLDEEQGSRCDWPRVGAGILTANRSRPHSKDFGFTLPTMGGRYRVLRKKNNLI